LLEFDGGDEMGHCGETLAGLPAPECFGFMAAGFSRHAVTDEPDEASSAAAFAKFEACDAI